MPYPRKNGKSTLCIDKDIMSSKEERTNEDALSLSPETEACLEEIRKKLDKVIYEHTGYSMIAKDFVSRDYYLSREKE